MNIFLQVIFAINLHKFLENIKDNIKEVLTKIVFATINIIIIFLIYCSFFCLKNLNAKTIEVVKERRVEISSTEDINIKNTLYEKHFPATLFEEKR